MGTLIKYTKMILIAIYIVVTSIISLFICIARPFHMGNTRIIGRIYSWGVLKIAGIEVRVKDWQALKDWPRSAVVVSNHQNNFDVFIIGSFVPSHAVSVGKRIIAFFPFFGQIYWLAGHILIDRKKKKSALSTMDHAVSKIKNQKMRIWIMPEGTRNKSKGLLRFKKGAFHVAKQAQVPIIPITLSNYTDLVPWTSFRKVPVYVESLAPIDYATYKDQHITQIASSVYNIMDSKINELDHLVRG